MVNNKYKKNNKYKLKFLKSIDDKNFNKSNIYFKKYLQYNSKVNLFKNNITIMDSSNELNNFIDNIKKMFYTIYGTDIANKIFNEFNKSIKLNEINYPVELNLDTFMKKIFEVIYGNYIANDENGIFNQVNKIINDVNKNNLQIKELNNFPTESNNKMFDIPTESDNKKLDIPAKLDNKMFNIQKESNSNFINLNNKPNKNIRRVSNIELPAPFKISPPLKYDLSDKNYKFNIEISKISDKTDTEDEDNKLKKKYPNIIIY